MTAEEELLQAAQGVLKHWEERDCMAGWIKPLRFATRRMEQKISAGRRPRCPEPDCQGPLRTAIGEIHTRDCPQR